MEKEFWDKRYFENETGWNIGEISTPIKEYVDQLHDKTIKILIPGCGFGHEASYLFQNGFTNVYVMDISEAAIHKFQQNNPHFPKNQCLVTDFFAHTDLYDLILEQTFFCAIKPEMRDNYVKKTKELLNPNGKLIGVLFACDFEGGPPFGGNKDEYLARFSNHFSNIKLENCYNSIPARKNRELFIQIN